MNKSYKITSLIVNCLSVGKLCLLLIVLITVPIKVLAISPSPSQSLTPSSSPSPTTLPTLSLSPQPKQVTSIRLFNNYLDLNAVNKFTLYTGGITGSFGTAYNFTVTYNDFTSQTFPIQFEYVAPTTPTPSPSISPTLAPSPSPGEINFKIDKITPQNSATVSVNFSWNQVPGVLYYEIYDFYKEKWVLAQSSINSMGTSYSLENWPKSFFLLPNYSFRLRACLDTGYCYNSDPVIPPPLPTTTPPLSLTPSPSPFVKQVTRINFSGKMDLSLTEVNKITLESAGNPGSFYSGAAVVVYYNDNTMPKAIQLLFLYVPPTTPTPTLSPSPFPSIASPSPSLTRSPSVPLIDLKIDQDEIVSEPGHLSYRYFKLSWTSKSYEKSFSVQYRPEGLDYVYNPQTQGNSYEFRLSIDQSYTFRVVACEIFDCDFSNEVTIEKKELPPEVSLPPVSISPTPTLQSIDVGTKRKTLSLTGQTLALNLEEDGTKESFTVYYLSVGVAPWVIKGTYYPRYPIKFIYSPKNRLTTNLTLDPPQEQLTPGQSVKLNFSALSIGGSPIKYIHTSIWPGIESPEDKGKVDPRYQAIRGSSGQVITGVPFYIEYLAEAEDGTLEDAKNKLVLPHPGAAPQIAKKCLYKPLPIRSYATHECSYSPTSCYDKNQSSIDYSCDYRHLYTDDSFTLSSAQTIGVDLTPTDLGYKCDGQKATLFWKGESPKYQLRVDVDPDTDSWNGTCSSVAGDFCENSLQSSSYTYNISPNKKYQFWIAGADNSSNNYPSSKTVQFSCSGSVSPPTPPTMLDASCLNGQAAFSWTHTGDPRFAIRIDDNLNSWGGYTIQPGDIINDNVLSNHFLTNLQTGHTYSWWVQSLNSKGEISTQTSGENFTCN